MGLFSRKKDNVEYIDLDQVNKSFRRGKATSVNDIDIAGNAPSVGGDYRKLEKNNVIKRKQVLNNVSQNALVQAIIRTRTSQVLPYCTPARYANNGVGYRVVPKSVKDKGPTSKQQERAKSLEDFIYNTGKTRKEWRDSFPEFITKLIRDMYVQDQVNIERLYESKTSNRLNHFNLVDASTIVIDKRRQSSDDKDTYEQIINDKSVAKFNSKQLTFITFWGNSDINTRGYGYSPTEATLDYLGYHTVTTEFNARFFSQGGTTRGLLLVQGDKDTPVSQQALNALRRSWESARGINGAWRIPVLTASDAKYINMTQSSKDMEFSEWLNYLINMISSIFQINPAEINFPNKGGGSTGRGNSTLNEGKTAKTNLDASLTKGLKPIMDFIERVINDYILPYVDDNYRFEFTLGSQDEKATQEILALKLKNGMTINESRKAMGLKPLPDDLGVGNVPGNADNVLQYLSVQGKFDSEASAKIQAQGNLNRTGADNNDNPNQVTNESDVDGQDKV